MSRQWNNFIESRNDQIVTLTLATQSKGNSYNAEFWFELRDFLQQLAVDTSARALIINAEGKHFGGGMSVDYLREMNVSKGNDPARYNHWIRQKVIFFQEVIGLLDTLPIPVIAQASGACIGGSLALYSACDIRLADTSAFFSIYEINVGIMCDLGTVQRITRLCGETLSSHMAFTGNSIDAERAYTSGLITEVLASRQDMVARAEIIAKHLASMSPLALAGLKETISACRNLHFDASLKASATWNAGMYTTSDIGAALSKSQTDQTPRFADLYLGDEQCG